MSDASISATAQPSTSIFRWFWDVWRTSWLLGVITLFLIVFATVCFDVLFPYLVADIFDQLSKKGVQWEDISSEFYGAVACQIGGFIGWRSSSFIIIYRQPLLLAAVENNIFNRITRYSNGFFADRPSGGLVSQAKRAVSAFEGIEDSIMFAVTPMSTRVLISLVVLAFVLPSAAIFLSLWLLLFLVSTFFLNRRILPWFEQASHGDSLVTAQMADILSNIANVRVFAKHQQERQRFRDTTSQRATRQQRAWRRNEYLNLYVFSMIAVLQIGFLVVIILSVINHNVGLTAALLAQFYVGRIISDMIGFGDLNKRMVKAFGDAKEALTTMALPIEIEDCAHPMPFPVPDTADITFHQVGFSYIPEQPVFEHFQLHVHNGEKIGIVGHSGSGKSTLTKLLLRLQDIQEGRILINNIDIRQMAQDDLRRAIAYVPQDPVLFHRSIRDNLTYARDNIPQTELDEAVRMAKLDDLIDQLPDGYETMVGERGVKLSGGERQRVAIARALLHHAPILVLDEATSSLDSRSEHLITAAIENLMRDRTTLVIAHRLSTVQRLDRILVLDNGKLVEQGTHDELLQILGGVYADLWAHQSGGMLGE